jgi:hypothetical protein
MLLFFHLIDRRVVPGICWECDPEGMRRFQHQAWHVLEQKVQQALAAHVAPRGTGHRGAPKR